MQGLLQQDLNEIYKYGEEWMIKFNTNNTIQQHFTYRKQKFVPNLKFGLTPIPVKTKHKHLGVTISNDLRFKEHVNDIIRKVNINISPLYSICSYLPRKILSQIYMTHVMPFFDYGDVLYDGLLTAHDTLRLERLQNRAARLVTATLFRTPTDNLRRELGWTSLNTRREIHKMTFFSPADLWRYPNLHSSTTTTRPKHP